MKRVFEFVLFLVAVFYSGSVFSQAAAVDIEWVRIPGGSFIMGSSGKDAEEDETPAHKVNVPEFEMSKTLVTLDQYKACVDAGVCETPDTEEGCNWGKSDRGNHPINCVDWEQAQAFATWAGGRLPSEAEWEYAARSATRGWKHPWGNKRANCSLAVMTESSKRQGCGNDGTWPVCSKPKGNTAQGLCDMSGNVMEWVKDWYYYGYKGAPKDGSAREVKGSPYKVCRGGFWGGHARNMQAAVRVYYPPEFRENFIGFRIARPVPAKHPEPRDKLDGDLGPDSDVSPDSNVRPVPPSPQDFAPKNQSKKMFETFIK
ncbi:MAG TPA: formylglycine-generating enzyme family protein [Myxococcota bacterium]|nr:formylglycine-generating enzyme family protein [Myxococcota bacterium]